MPSRRWDAQHIDLCAHELRDANVHFAVTTKQPFEESDCCALATPRCPLNMIEEGAETGIAPGPKAPDHFRSGLVSQRVQMYESPTSKARASSVPRPRPNDVVAFHQRAVSPRSPARDNDGSRSERSRSPFVTRSVAEESRNCDAASPVSAERSVNEPSKTMSRSMTPRTPTPQRQLAYSRSSPVSPRPRDSFAPNELRDEEEALRATPKASGATQRRMNTPSPRPRGSFPVPSSPSSSMNQKAVNGSTFKGCTLIESGVRYYSEGDYEKALKAFTAALKTQRVSGKKDDIAVALTLGNMGSVYLQQNNLFEAEQVLLESLDIKRRISPDLVVADTLNNLGNCMNLRGELEASLIYYEDALVDLRIKSGRKTDKINAYFNIGRLEIQRKHWTKAMMALNEACKLAKETYSTNHVFVAQTLDLMGFVQLSTLKLDAAMVSFTGALAIYRRLYGPMHLEVANSLFNVGMVREAKGENPDAWEAYTTARDLYSRIGTHKDHPGFTAVRRSIVKIERQIQGSKGVKKPKKRMPTTRITVSAK